MLAFGEVDDVAAGSATLFGRELESPAGGTREPGVVFGVGNSSCETAITMSERNRARKSAYPFRGPDRSRPAERDDTEEFDQP